MKKGGKREKRERREERGRREGGREKEEVGSFWDERNLGDRWLKRNITMFACVSCDIISLPLEFSERPK